MQKNIIAKGIDVSYSNGRIDWDKMKNNVDFVIIRCGYGGNYANQDDAQWLANVNACEEKKIPYGVYLYSYATTVDKAKNEAKHVLRLLEGHNPDYPVFLDLEESRISALGKDKILEIAKVFCERITAAGYRYGTYANKYWYDTYLTDSWYGEYPKWIAQYNKQCTYNGKYDIWQYSKTGKFNGFEGNFDLNYCYTSFVEGDADGDGKVTAADARKVLRASAGTEKLTNDEIILADVDGDGNITAADARHILRDSAGIE
ncbi:MAG: hypothetical protein IJZ35_04950 [Clostridia bacterium]|nr:hypothetical protein [Clostridia bacterium]